MKLTHPDGDLVIDVADTQVDRYLTQGWRPATVDAPKGNAPKADWVAFAVAQGLDEAGLEGMGRDEIRAALS